MASRVRAFAFLAGLLLPSLLAAGSPADPALEELMRYEAQLLEQASSAKGARFVFGSDPYAVVHIPQTRQVLVLLRNASEVLLLDSSLRIIDRKQTPKAPRGWAVADGNYVWITGELSNRIVLYEINEEELVSKAEFVLKESAGLRDITYAPAIESLFVIDAPRRQLIQLTLDAGWRHGVKSFRTTTYSVGAGPLQIEYGYGYLFLNLLLEHRLDVIPLHGRNPDFSRKHTISHDGPIWGFDVTKRGENLLLAAVGVEDRPLDRTTGEFGYIDSFLFVYELHDPEATRDSARLRQLAVRNLSAQHIVTPKTVRFAREKDALVLWVLGFGSDRGAAFVLSGRKLSLGKTFQTPPGSTDIAVIQDDSHTYLLAANTLLDQLYKVPRDTEGVQKTQLSLDNRYPSTESRIGELLFFTTLFSPHNRAEGQLSRFTCESCHFEGTIDGRVHFTGRGEVFATTKTLRNLANNVPLFSRAGDRSLASMVVQEFRVANQERRADFSIETAAYPWLREIDGIPAVLGPLDLRKGFLSFFIHFRHKPNPWLVTRKKLSAEALDGIEVFRARCEYCHRAIPSTRSDVRVPPERWQAVIENESTDLVWGAPFYTKTNIRPYVSKRGARVPSLRRISEKYPYFTNGSSRDLRDVLERFRYKGATAWHHYEGPDGAEIKALTENQIRQLEELLRFF